VITVKLVLETDTSEQQPDDNNDWTRSFVRTKDSYSSAQCFV
jgi:hypothetical protein